MNTLGCVFLLGCLSSMMFAYPTGPPVNSDLCISMMPNHNASAQATDPPYQILTSDTCYGPNTVLTVRIRITDPDNEDNFFEGFFMQARVDRNTSSNYGTFNTLNTAYINTPQCHGNTNSTVAHTAAHHYLARTVQWTAPSRDEGTIKFVATIVKAKDTFWMGAESDEIRYNTSCAGNGKLSDETFDDIAPETECASSEEGCVTASPETECASSEEGCGCAAISAELALLASGLFVSMRLV